MHRCGDSLRSMSDCGTCGQAVFGFGRSNHDVGTLSGCGRGVGPAVRHRFHALCPYFAMFPESFAETWIERLTNRGDVVLDPFSGRGTTPLQALLMNRHAVACDVNDVAYCLTRAKTAAPRLSSVRRRITQLENDFDGRSWRAMADEFDEFFHRAYRKRTLQQLCYLRQRLQWRNRDTDAMIAALVMGSLHGEMDKSSSYLSNQMPRTISTKPASGYPVRSPSYNIW